MKVFQVRLLTRLVKILGRPNKAVSSGRIAARLIEWHLAGGVQPLAITMNEGVCLAVEVDQQHIQRRLDTGYCDEMASTLDEALHQVREACNQGQPLSIGLIGNAAEVYPELVRRGIIFTNYGFLACLLQVGSKILHAGICVQGYYAPPG